MPYAHSIEGRIVHVRWHGSICEADLDRFAAEMPRIGCSLGRAPDVLHTYAEVVAGLPPAEAFLYSLRGDPPPIPNPIRVAMVANTPECEALASVFKTLNRTPNLEMAVFADEPAARRWLARE